MAWIQNSGLNIINKRLLWERLRYSGCYFSAASLSPVFFNPPAISVHLFFLFFPPQNNFFLGKPENVCNCQKLLCQKTAPVCPPATFSFCSLSYFFDSLLISHSLAPSFLFLLSYLLCQSYIFCWGRRKEAAVFFFSTLCCAFTFLLALLLLPHTSLVLRLLNHLQLVLFRLLGECWLETLHPDKGHICLQEKKNNRSRLMSDVHQL